MKKISFSLISAIMIMIPLSYAAAHPGRTDANGGHTCRTNCEKWGRMYGEYHYHNGGSSSSSSNSNSTYSPASNLNIKTPVQNPAVTIIAVDKAYVYSYPEVNDSYINGSYMAYGQNATDEGSTYSGWSYLTFTDGTSGYISKNVTTQYMPMETKTITIQTEKAYIFNIPSDKGTSRGFFTKNRQVTAIGSNGNFYYVSTTDYKGNPLFGFVSKTVAW